MATAMGKTCSQSSRHPEAVFTGIALGEIPMANTKGVNAKTKHQTRKQGVISQTASAEQAENKCVRAIAERPMLGDPKSDIRNTDYWACKPK